MSTKLRIRSAWLRASPVEFMLSKINCGIVLIAAQRNIHDHELLQTLAKWGDVIAQCPHLLFEESEVLYQTQGVLIGDRFCSTIASRVCSSVWVSSSL